VRDAEGSVIGVAARHWGTTAQGLTTTWSILIPSRGALLLSAAGEARGAVDRALQSAGHGAGSEWSGELAVTLTPTDGSSRVVSGGGEFDNLAGSYTETWTLTGVVDTGSCAARSRAQHSDESPMRHLFVALFGLLLGAAAAGVFLPQPSDGRWPRYGSSRPTAALLAAGPGARVLSRRGG
jgi:hypothetical protein